MDWKIFFNKPESSEPDTWRKTFKPGESRLKLDEETCDGARAFYGNEHLLVKLHCTPGKVKYKVVWK